MFASRSKSVTRSAIMAVLVCSALSSIEAAAQTQPAQKTQFVVKDARNIEPDSVRFAAAQGTEKLPNIALFGGTKEGWPKIRGAVIQSEQAGFPVRAILVGPSNVTPSLEIYAKGWKVTEPIDPNKITQAQLVQLIRDIHRGYYPQ